MNLMRWVSWVLLLGSFRLVSAEEMADKSQPEHIISYTSVLQWGFSLIVVLAIFVMIIWLLRKTGSLNFSGKSQLAIISGLSLGMREKLVLIKVGEKQLLLGVTPGRVDKLLELEGDARLFQNQEAAGLNTFANKLQQVMQSHNEA